MKKVEPIKIALLAVGGDGGSVFTSWCVNLAKNCGYFASSTSIAGVAQRTGSTLYYLELLPQIEIKKRDKTPVLSQMPIPGDVDIVIATEIVEIGRALNRGLISEKTTVVFSSHRSLAISEKSSSADEIIDAQKIIDEVEKHTKSKIIYSNFKKIAKKNGSVISSSLLGALCGSGALPFSKENFEKVIIDDKIGVENSIRTFREAYDDVKSGNKNKLLDTGFDKATLSVMPKVSKNKEVQKFINRIKKYDKNLHDIAYLGVIHTSNWHDHKWGTYYLDELEKVIAIDSKEKNFSLSFNYAKYLSTALSYDDLICVSAIKTSKKRLKEVRAQVEAKEEELVEVLDFLHPGLEEFCGFMPKGLGAKLSKSEKFKNFFTKYLDRDRRMKSTNLVNFLVLYFVGSLKNWRFKSFRHFEEMENVDFWNKRIEKLLSTNYELAVLAVQSYRVKKGYGDTFHRSHSKFKMLLNLAMEIQNHSNAISIFDDAFTIALNNPDTSALQREIVYILKNKKEL